MNGTLDVADVATLRRRVDALQPTPAAKARIGATARIDVESFVGGAAETRPEKQGSAKGACATLTALAVHLRVEMRRILPQHIHFSSIGVVSREI